ncbi:hypothetical protein B0H19DRAFT_1265679 [Mycena capillaripes]|nr:hypothetical protein B0H19DRAFT_1265679 [Mycena capillaripes]
MCQGLARVTFRKPETITTRGKSFMRALLTHDYQSLMLDMCSRKVHFIYEHPDQQAVTVFNYSSTDGVEIKVGRSSDLESFDPASEILLQFPRESRSGGRMDLHVMATSEGDTSRLHLFPMRTSTAKLHRLAAAAQEIREIPRNTPRAEGQTDSAGKAGAEKLVKLVRISSFRYLAVSENMPRWLEANELVKNTELLECRSRSTERAQMMGEKDRI